MVPLVLLIALILTVMNAFGKCPLWIPVLMVILMMLAPSLPLR
jgi:hypothetical protein